MKKKLITPDMHLFYENVFMVHAYKKQPIRLAYWQPLFHLFIKTQSHFLLSFESKQQDFLSNVSTVSYMLPATKGGRWAKLPPTTQSNSIWLMVGINSTPCFSLSSIYELQSKFFLNLCRKVTGGSNAAWAESS